MARRLLELVLCTALLGASGCGDSEPDATPRQSKAVAQAAKAMRDQTLQMRVLRTGNIPGEGNFSFKGEGSMRGDGSRGAWKGKLVDVRDQELRVEIRIDGRHTWTGGDDLEGLLPGGAKWIHSERVLAIDRAITPWFLADLLEGIYDVDDVGEKQVEGEPATHYRGVADVWPLRKSVPELAVDGRRGERLPIDVWLADGLPKRLRIDYHSGNRSFYMDAVVLGRVAGEMPGAPPDEDVVEVADLQR